MADFKQTGGNNGGQYSQHFSGILTVIEESYNVISNTSSVYYELKLQSGSSGRFTNYNANYSVSINGKAVNSGSGTYSSNNYNTAQTICNGRTTIEHNSDGTKTISCSAVLDFSGGTYSPGSFYPNGNLVLTTIPRASSISCTTANVGETAIIVINSAVADWNHNVFATFDGEETMILTWVKGGTYSWTIPESYYEKIKTSKSGTGTLLVRTFNGEQWVGEKTINFTVTTNEEICKPSVSATVIDINSDTVNLTENNNKLIKYKSTAKVQITSNAKNSASIVTTRLNGQAISGNGISVSNVETNSFVIEVIDSRGYSNSVTITKEMIDYIPLSLGANVKRRNPTSSEVLANLSGNYFNGSLGSTQNTLEITWKYKRKNENTYTNGGTITSSISNNKYTANNKSLGELFYYQNAYDIRITAEDKLSTVVTNLVLTQGIPIMNWEQNFVNVNGEIRQNGINIFELIFPIGSPYFTPTDTNPSEMLGFGTWERLRGRIPLGLDEYEERFDEIGKIGGGITHSLTKAELPPISFDAFRGTGTTGWGGVLGVDNCDGVRKATQELGGISEEFSIVQPYKIVGYMWIRTA